MRRIATVLIVALGLALLLGATPAMAAAPSWTDYGSNPVWDPEPGGIYQPVGTWQSRAYYPDVLYSATGFDGHGPSWAYKCYYDDGANTWLIYSNDFKTWYRYGVAPVIAGLRHPQVVYDPAHFGDDAGDVIQASSPATYAATPFYKAWLWNGLNGNSGDIRFAYSSDGEVWHGNYTADVVPNKLFPIFFDSDVYDVEVLFTGTAYRGWADNNGILYNVSSSDGTTWTISAEATALPLGAVGQWDSASQSRMSVIKVSDSEWHAWYGGSTAGGGNLGIGYASSSDGLSWSKDTSNPIPALGGFGAFGGLGAPGTWNASRNYAMSVLYDPAGFSGHGDTCQFKMIRSGVDSTSDYSLGIAYSETTATPTALSSIVSTNAVPPSGHTTIWGTLTAAGTSIGSLGRTVMLEADTGSGFAPVGPANYDAGTDTYWATYPVTVDPTTLRLVFAGDATYGASTSSTHVITLTGPPNTPPVALDDSYTALRDTTLTVPADGVLTNDTDAEDDPLTASVVSTTAHGTLVLAPTGGFTYRPAGGYTGADVFVYRANDGKADSANATVTITVRTEAAVERIGGSDRYAVAERMAGEAFPGWTGIGHVIVASGLDAAAADPLSAAGLAGVYEAPVLLVRGDVQILPPATVRALTAIRDNNAGTIYVHIVGGTASVPDWVKTEIREISTRFDCNDRAGGADRYYVAANVGYKMRTRLASSGGEIPGVFIANGRDSSRYYDPLAVGPIAYRMHMPILLAGGTSMPNATRDAVLSLEPTAANRYVAGPTSAIGGNIMTLFSIPPGNRLHDPADSSRYGTARAIAEYALDPGRSWLETDYVGVANRIPDALTGGAGLGRFGGPILYTPASPLDGQTEAFLHANRSGIVRVYVLGGPASVTDATLAEIAAAVAP